MRIGLISCSKGKLDHAAPAHQLYTGPMFKLYKEWIIKQTVVGACNAGQKNEWGILSAKHGLVLPDQVVEPYDLTLTDLTDKQRKMWEDMVYRQLLKQWGDGVIYTVLAGGYYRSVVHRMSMWEDPIDHWTELRRAGGMTRRRAGMSIGILKRKLNQELERLSWISPELLRKHGQLEYLDGTNPQQGKHHGLHSS